MTLEKISLKTRIKSLYDFDLNPEWDRIFIVTAGILLNLLVCYLLGLYEQFDLVLLVSVFIQGVMIEELPRKKFFKIILIYAVVTALALFTATLGSQYTILAVIFFILWFAVFTIVHISGFEVSKVGLHSVFIYFFGFVMLSEIHPGATLTMIAALYYALAGIIMVLIGSIPALLVNYIKNDPYKRELIAELFKPNITFNEIIENQSAILESDDTTRTRSLINIAIKIYVLNNNIENLRYSLDNDLKEEFDGFLDEINKLLCDVEDAISNGTDDNLQVNTENIDNIQKELSDKIEKIENKTSNQAFLLKSVSQYNTIFNNLNKVLSNDLIVNDIDLDEMKEGYVNNIKNNLNKDNVDLKYGIRFAIAGVISFIADLLIGNFEFEVTTTSEFTLSPDHRSTAQGVVLRIISTFLAIFATFIVAILLIHVNLAIVAPIIAIIAFILYYVYEEDYPVAMFFLISGVILLKPVVDIPETLTEELLASFIAFIIVLFANYCILPSRKSYNITEIILNKIQFSGKHIKNITQNKDEVKLHNFEIYETNNLFDGAIDRFESLYEVGDDLTSFKELSKALDNLVNTVLFVIDSEKSQNILSKVIPDFFTHITEVIKDERDVTDVFDEFTLIENRIDELNKSSEDKVLSLKYRHVLTDLEYINDIVLESKRKRLFNKYNEAL